MKNKALNEHYQQILGNTSPWTVSEVRLDVEHLVNEVKLAILVANPLATVKKNKKFKQLSS